jgi:hypothetical protein
MAGTVTAAAPNLLLDLGFLPSPHGKIGLGLHLRNVLAPALQIGFELGGSKARLRCYVEDLSTCVCQSGRTLRREPPLASFRGVQAEHTGLSHAWTYRPTPPALPGRGRRRASLASR